MFMDTVLNILKNDTVQTVFGVALFVYSTIGILILSIVYDKMNKFVKIFTLFVVPVVISLFVNSGSIKELFFGTLLYLFAFPMFTLICKENLIDS